MTIVSMPSNDNYREGWEKVFGSCGCEECSQCGEKTAEMYRVRGVVLCNHCKQAWALVDDLGKSLGDKELDTEPYGLEL